MTEWPESIPRYLHNTPMGESMRITMKLDSPEARAMLYGPGLSFAKPVKDTLASSLDTGEKIKAKRLALDMSQSAVASELDCSPAYISQIEAKESIDRKTDLAFRAIFAAKQANQE